MPCTLYVSTFLKLRMLMNYLHIDDSPDFTEDMRDAMAQAVHPALMELVRLHGEHETLPSHCFVYGVHLSPTHLTLCAHFPTRQTNKTTEITSWRFRQVVVAKYLLRSDPIFENSHEELLYSRWRLLLSLFTVLKHTQLLCTELQHQTSETEIDCSVAMVQSS